MPSKESTPAIETQVALLNQFNKDVVRPALDDLKETQKKIQQSLEALDFVHKSDFVEYKIEVEQQFTTKPVSGMAPLLMGLLN